MKLTTSNLVPRLRKSGTVSHISYIISWHNLYLFFCPLFGFFADFHQFKLVAFYIIPYLVCDSCLVLVSVYYQCKYQGVLRLLPPPIDFLCHPYAVHSCWHEVKFPCFYVLLTMHLSIILDNDQLDTHLLYFTIRLL